MSGSGVRRAKAALSSGCKPHPATAPAGSNRSSYGGDEIAEAFGMRATNWWQRECAGRNASERRASLEKDDAQADPTGFSGKADTAGLPSGNHTPSRCAGVVATACTQGKRTQHGRSHGVVRDDQPDAREGEAGRRGETERFVVPLKPENAGGGKGPQFKTNAKRSEGPGDWATYQPRRVFRSCRRRCTRKRRQKPAIASTPCTTRSAARKSWLMPTLSAAPTRAHRGWMARILRTSKRMGYSGGSANWRLRSGRRLTDRTPSEECTYRRPMANSGRWASRPCAIGSA